MFISGVRKSLSEFGSNGFTLVELMAAVAIVGVLAAVAIPQYQASVAKARQAEATQELSKIYVQEHMFYTEWGFYSSCLTDMGYHYLQPTRYYAVGFGDTPATDTKCGPTSAPSIPCNQIPTSPVTNCAHGAITGGNDPNLYHTVFASNVMANTAMGLPVDADFPTNGVGPTTFSAGAVGNIRTNAVFDKWTIDQDKTVKNVQSGM
jgi:prepilin-type N-terminal cleavage/methylation domain-containing protein